MNRTERFANENATMLAVLRGWQAGVFTSDIGIVSGYNPATETCSVTLATQHKVRRADGSEVWTTLPQLVDVPVSFPGGGGYTLTFPVQVGDECVVVFAQRCLDAWFQSGGVQVQAELRMHDISDGIAFVGIKSQPRTLSPAAHASNVQLRSDDGACYIEMSGGVAVKVLAPGGINLNGVTIDAAGNVTSPTTVTAATVTGTTDVVFAGKSSKTHKHTGVTTGASQTGAPA